MTKQRFTVVFEHGDRPNQWLASVREIPQVHTFGRGLAQTRARILEALQLWQGEKAAAAQIDEVLPLPSAMKKKIERIDALKSRAEELVREAKQQQDAVIAFLQADWSLRDISEVLTISHQRVAQVSAQHGKPAARRRARVAK